MKNYSLEKIEERLRKGELPFSGKTELESSAFNFVKPAFYAGIAMHAGSKVRPEIKKILAVSDEDRLREEDPYTDRFIEDFDIQIVCLDSRFEYDVNRDFERAIYDEIKKTWGLVVWKRPLKPRERALSIAKHREFHDLMDIVAQYLLSQNRYALVFDVHSFCYQRQQKIPWGIDKKPVLNIGTKAANRSLFGPVIDQLMDYFSEVRIENHKWTVAENDIFSGGFLSRRFGKIYHDNLLLLALEFKKIFMDEWSGELYPQIFEKMVTSFSDISHKLLKHELFTSIT